MSTGAETSRGNPKKTARELRYPKEIPRNEHGCGGRGKTIDKKNMMNILNIHNKNENDNTGNNKNQKNIGNNDETSVNNNNDNNNNTNNTTNNNKFKSKFNLILNLIFI